MCCLHNLGLFSPSFWGGPFFCSRAPRADISFKTKDGERKWTSITVRSSACLFFFGLRLRKCRPRSPVPCRKCGFAAGGRSPFPPHPGLCRSPCRQGDRHRPGCGGKGDRPPAAKPHFLHGTGERGRHFRKRRPKKNRQALDRTVILVHFLSPSFVLKDMSARGALEQKNGPPQKEGLNSPRLCRQHKKAGP